MSAMLQKKKIENQHGRAFASPLEILEESCRIIRFAFYGNFKWFYIYYHQRLKSDFFLGSYFFFLSAEVGTIKS